MRASSAVSPVSTYGACISVRVKVRYVCVSVCVKVRYGCVVECVRVCWCMSVGTCKYVFMYACAM